MTEERYFKCEKCGQEVQGFEASQWYDKPCVDGPFHKWTECDGPGPYLPPQDGIVNLAEIRRAVALYMQSEGCDCCQDVVAHREHAKKLAELLDVPPHPDGWGYNFEKFAEVS